MEKLVYCYHTHTKRCGHAIGEDEEYVKAAIKFGIKRLGFSDHVILPRGYEQKWTRGSFDELDGYINSIKSLKEKYKDQIDIKIGFEAEYSEAFLGYYRDLLKNKIDYLILGQHCYEEDGRLLWYFDKDAPIEAVQKHVDHVISGLKTGLFKYVAHPDVFMISQGGWNQDLERESRRILKTCEELNIPVELNMCGMRRPTYNEVNYSYPNINFYKLVKEYKVKVVLGPDVHNPEHFFDGTFEKAVDFAKRAGLTIDWDFII